MGGYNIDINNTAHSLILRDGDNCTEDYEYYDYDDYDYENSTYDTYAYSYDYENDTLDYYDTLDEYTLFVNSLVHKITWVYIPPILLIIGTIGNLLSFYVFWQPAMRKSLASWFFRILAVVDTVCLHYGILTYYIPRMLNYHPIPLTNISCKITPWLKYCISQLSAWILVLMTVERAIGVTWPHRAKQLCTKRRAIISLAAIIVILMCLNFTPLIIEGHTQVCHKGVVKSLCIQDSEYTILQHFVQPNMDLLLMAVCPFLIMISSNILIIYKAFYSQRLVNRSNNHLLSMTTTLLLVVFVFILLTSPFCAYSVLRIYQFESKERWMKYGQVFYNIADIMRYVNNSINFFLYALSGRPFRMEIRKMMSSASVTDQKSSDKFSTNTRYKNTRKYSGTSMTKLSYTVI